MSTKIFITGPSNIDKLSLAKKLVERDDDLSIGDMNNNNKIDLSDIIRLLRIYLNS